VTEQSTKKATSPVCVLHRQSHRKVAELLLNGYTTFLTSLPTHLFTPMAKDVTICLFY